MDKLLLIVNPKSGRAKMRSELLGVTETLSSKYDVTVYITKSRLDATERVKRIKDNEYKIIVVCGGDGTLNEVITGLMQSNQNTTIAYIPCGTLNEWSSSLGIARNIQEAAKDILNGKEIDLDIGKFGEKYFSYTASFGAFTDASYSAPQDVKNVLGQAAYFFEGIKSLANIKPLHLKFKTDDREIEGDFLFGAVSNSMSVGGIVKFDKAVVELDDGIFEIMLIRKPESIIELQGIIDGILRKDLSKDGIEFFHTKSITVYESKDIPWTLDGEFSEGYDEVYIENIHSAIHLIVPNND
ncbi:MAG: diacylglycerol kinase family lipid kinase [Clostridia bacterium]|nr:diacylglycerol kinase family lipid kinase [Clostridia bacterium]